MAIASIHIEHYYYNPPINHLMELEPTPQTRKLMKQRGVIFGKSNENEWQWIKPDDAPGFADDDAPEVSMMVRDSHFLQKIEGNGYSPGSFYKLMLDDRDVEVSAGYVWKKETDGQRLKNEFCRIILRPAKTIPASGCRKFTIRFSASAYYWEFLFIFKEADDRRGKDLKLKAPKDVVAFGPPEKYEKTNWGTNVWRITSMERINAKERYDIPLQLYIGRVIESRFISPPQIGKYLSESYYTIREIYYIK